MSNLENPTFGSLIRSLREQLNLPIRHVAAALKLDPSTLSKIERNERLASRDQVLLLAKVFKVNPRDLLVSYHSDKIAYALQEEDFHQEILKAAEKKMKYVRTKNK